MNINRSSKDFILAVVHILFYPICGFFESLRECKGNDFEDFMEDWEYYLLFVFFWICGVGVIGLLVYGLKYHFVETIISVSLISTAIFFIVILPHIIYKLVNKK